MYLQLITAKWHIENSKNNERWYYFRSTLTCWHRRTYEVLLKFFLHLSLSCFFAFCSAMDILSVGFICHTRLVDTGSLVECSSVLWVVQFTILSHMAFVCLSVCVSLLLFLFYCCLWIFVVWIRRLIDWLIDWLIEDMAHFPSQH